LRVVLFEGQFKRLFIVGFSALFLLIAEIAVLLAMAYAAGGVDFMYQVLHMQVGSRIIGNNSPHFYYYFTDAIGAYALAFPLAILFLIGLFPKLIQKKPSKYHQFLRILFGWVFIILLGLSCVGDKKLRYALAISPALALICGGLLVMSAQTKYLTWLRKGFIFFAVFCLCFAWGYCMRYVIIIFHYYTALTVPC